MILNVTFVLEYGVVTVSIEVDNEVTDERAAKIANEIFEDNYGLDLYSECRGYEVYEGSE